ncbi:MAG: tRNA epoxyqueuosine(34) reductase QueG [Proteobacteria bacterium]|nr:tRNA epoxyqueuosine(34) reductase QueG [Burkholderiales bacterium]
MTQPACADPDDEPLDAPPGLEGRQPPGRSAAELAALAQSITRWASELGFQQTAIAALDLAQAKPRLIEWLAQGFHGELDYMARHASLRANPDALVPGAVRSISVRMDYWPAHAADAHAVLADRSLAYVSRYALGRDYHKLLRTKLARLAARIEAAIGPFGYRVFTDSAPVMEVEFAAAAGLGWRGKHTLLLERERGSWFFLGEILTDLPLPVGTPVTAHCGSCTRCLDICPTQAIVAPYRLDARRCISYLTIELKGSIPEALRAPIGNRVYGCDDCQLVCPWNRYAQPAVEPAFAVRHGLDRASLVELFAWSQSDFDDRMAGSAIRRIGYVRWSRNLAVGLGNAPTSPAVVAALRSRQDDPSALVREHVAWALAQHQAHATGAQIF